MKNSSVFNFTFKFCEGRVEVGFQKDLFMEIRYSFMVSVVKRGVIFRFTCSPEEYYLLDILDYIYRLMRKDLRYYSMPRPVYK